MALNITRKKLIIGGIVLLVLVIGSASYAIVPSYINNLAVTSSANSAANSNANGSSSSSETEYNDYKEQAAFKKKEAEATKLAEAGDQTSVDQADKIMEEQTAAAEKTGNDEYITEATIAQATVLIETDRAQEALDTILFPLEKKYAGKEPYIYEIYAAIAYAYRTLDNQSKADEYFAKIKGGGWE